MSSLTVEKKRKIEEKDIKEYNLLQYFEQKFGKSQFLFGKCDFEKIILLIGEHCLNFHVESQTIIGLA